MGITIKTTVQIGVPTDGSGQGWTIVLPVLPVQAPSGVGAGSRQIYVAQASSGGSDSNAGTINAPFLTIAHGCLSLRANKSDQVLLACGDTFDLGADTGFFNNVPIGALPGPIRNDSNLGSTLTCSGPILLGSYQKPAAISTARPKVQITSALSNGNCAGSSGGVWDNVVVQGIEFYAWKRDPTQGNYTAAEAAFAAFGAFMGDTVTYNLWEDCLWRYFATGLAYNTANNMPTNAINFNRCLVVDCYPAGTGNGQGIFVGGPFALVNPNVLNITNCLSDQNGWNQLLMQPVSVSVANSTTFTWTGTPPFVSGSTIQPSTTAGALTAQARYVAQNISGNNFQLFTGPGTDLVTNAATSTSSNTLHFASVPSWVVAGQTIFDQGTPSGAVGTVLSTTANTVVLTANSSFAVQSGDPLSFGPLPTTGISTQSMQWTDTAGSALSRNLYIDAPYTMINTITSNSSSEGHNGRQGGVIRKNLCLRNSGHDLGDIIDGYTVISNFECAFNVYLYPTDIASVPIQPRKGGLLISNVIASGGSASIHDNVFVHGNGSAAAIELDDNNGNPTGGVGGVVTYNNVIFGWGGGNSGNGYQDDAGNAANGHINTTVNNIFDAAKANNLGSPEPFSSPGDTRDVASYSLSIGGTGEADFMQKARARSRLGGWDTRYDAIAVINHLRPGLNLSSI